MGKKVLEVILTILSFGITAIVREKKRRHRQPEFNFEGKIKPMSEEKKNEEERKR